MRRGNIQHKRREAGGGGGGEREGARGGVVLALIANMENTETDKRISHFAKSL